MAELSSMHGTRADRGLCCGARALLLACALLSIRCEPEPEARPSEPPAPSQPVPVPVPVPAPAPAPPDGMVLVPAAEFYKGRVPDDQGMEPGAMVKVGAFFIDKLEVTAEQYDRCVTSGECSKLDAKGEGCTAGRAKLADHPVNCVEWYQADRYCRAYGKRLPTDAEWELAARGTDRRVYPWGNAEPGDQLCRQGRTVKPSPRTCPVGSFPDGASPYGVLDMAGNVAEWTATEADNPAGRTYVAKGGGYLVDPMESPELRDVRVDNAHHAWGTWTREAWLGFRCVK